MNEGVRLDLFLSGKFGITRNYAQKLIREGCVKSGGKILTKPSLKFFLSDELEIAFPPIEQLDLTPEYVPFDVVFEDEFLIVLDKPAGVVVHPAPGHWTKTLVHGLLHRYPEISCGNAARPGIVHRLDASTSGLMVVARETRTMERLQKMFAAREVEKTYLALAHGEIKQTSGTIDAPIDRDPRDRLKMAVVDGGKKAITKFNRLWTREKYSFVSCELITGRTHQIRVHFAAIGHPLVGDVLYGGSPALLDRVFLHSWKLKFTHPMTGESLSLRCHLPSALTSAMKKPRQ